MAAYAHTKLYCTTQAVREQQDYWFFTCNTRV